MQIYGFNQPRLMSKRAIISKKVVAEWGYSKIACCHELSMLYFKKRVDKTEKMDESFCPLIFVLNSLNYLNAFIILLKRSTQKTHVKPSVNALYERKVTSLRKRNTLVTHSLVTHLVEAVMKYYESNTEINLPSGCY